MVYSTVEYLAICASGQQFYTICSCYPIWAESWPTSHFAIQAMSEFQFSWSQSMHQVWPHLACPQLTQLNLVALSGALGLSKTGTCDELKAHIKQHIQENKVELTKQPRFTVLFSTRRRKAALALGGVAWYRVVHTPTHLQGIIIISLVVNTINKSSASNTGLPKRLTGFIVVSILMWKLVMPKVWLMWLVKTHMDPESGQNQFVG